MFSFFFGVVSRADRVGDIVHHAGCAFLREQEGVDPFVPQIRLYSQRTSPFFCWPSTNMA